MTSERYQELVGLVFDSELAAGEEEELARALDEHPEWRGELRRQLVLWELWSQTVAPERSAAAFVAAWKTRVAAEADASVFQTAVRTRLEREGARRIDAVRATLHTWWRTLWRPVGLAWATGATAVLALALWFAAPRSTAAVVTLRGEAVCPACVLHQGHEHLPAIRVGHGVDERVFFLERNVAVAGLQERFCGGPTPVVARGAVRMDGARAEFAAESVVLPRKKPPRKDAERVIFPL